MTQGVRPDGPHLFKWIFRLRELGKKTITLYMTEEPYQELRKRVLPKPVSQEIEELIRKRLAELDGREYSPTETFDYQDLKDRHTKLVRNIRKMEKDLKKDGAFSKLDVLARGFKIDTKAYSNLSEVTALMLKEYDTDGGTKENVHVFISLMEACKAKREIEAQLDAIRMASA